MFDISYLSESLPVAERLVIRSSQPFTNMHQSLPTTSVTWRRHYEQNASNEAAIPWHDGAKLTAAERRVIAESVREFQLGESSEGRNLITAAKAYAERSGDHEYVSAIEGFIREEQRHARYLGRFLTAEGIPLGRHSWADSIFRLLRRGAELEVTVSVLLTAEIIAQVYYQALYHATMSPVLRAICLRILADEAEHVRFQAERLAVIRNGMRAARIRTAYALQRLLFGSAVAVVWWKHSPVLKRGNMPWRIYWRSCWSAFATAYEMMRSEKYARQAAVEDRSLARVSAPAES